MITREICQRVLHKAVSTGADYAEIFAENTINNNISMIATAENNALTSAAVNWGPYYTYAVNCVLNGEEIATDWCHGYVDGATRITELNEKAVAAGTAEKVAEVEAALREGTLKVFDCSTFTVGGATLTEADDANIYDGYYHESEKASAPSFAYFIDGITDLTAAQ